MIKEEYYQRINKVIDYIEQNIDETFSLDQLADLSGFSKFHFHRIFHSLMNETLFQFIQRLRVEKAAYMLVVNRKNSITDIALDCGFSSSALFARTFKNAFKISPSTWRKKSSLYNQSDHNLSAETITALPAKTKVFYRKESQIWEIPIGEQIRKIEVKNFSQITVVYVRYVGPYAGDSKLFQKLWTKLGLWAGPRGLFIPGENEFLTIYHDDINITRKNRLRISCCVSVPPNTPVEGEIGKMTIPSGKYAFARFKLSETEYGKAWDWVYGTWLPASGYEPDDRPCFEYYPPTGGLKDPAGKITVDICIPVRPM
jgi:AraC family transcriptional regulator